MQNDDDEALTLEVDGEATDVPASSAVSLLDNGCSSGDVIIRFQSGETQVVDGPVCPPDSILVRDGTAVIVSS